LRLALIFEREFAQRGQGPGKWLTTLASVQAMQPLLKVWRVPSRLMAHTG